MIAHDRELTSTIQWIEYDPESDDFSLIHEDGNLQALGIEFDEKTKDNLLKSQEVVLLLVRNKEVVSKKTAIILIKEY